MRTTSRRLLTGFSAALLIAGAPLTAAPAAAASTSPAADRPTKVKVPSHYVYKPKLGALHDYCTLAPDEFRVLKAPNADFRGPCARHDLCYAASASQKPCDKALRRNMFRNCVHTYGRFNPLRTGCKIVAVTYWAAVVAA
jgi:hypothetical protein